MAVRDDRSDVKQTTTGFRGPLMVQSLTSAKSKFLSLILTLSIFLVSCGGGSSSSGTSLNLSGTWMLNPHSTSHSISFNSFQAVLQQSGNTVTSQSVDRSAPPGTISCSTGLATITGTVAGSTFNGQLKTNASTTTFSVSGTSSSLYGTFSTHFISGPCAYAGIVTGNVTLAKL